LPMATASHAAGLELRQTVWALQAYEGFGLGGSERYRLFTTVIRMTLSGVRLFYLQCGKTFLPCRIGSAYCFVAVNCMLDPRSLSSTFTVMVLPSEPTVICATLITFPSRLSVSSIVFFPMLFTETLVVPGSPL
jgi:hypothetical protein